ncbi:MAG: hypothetical protein HYZ28_16435 [Myxococcales bacterium]|nr:hypothetical protein [Myxococcales bacterium]
MATLSGHIPPPSKLVPNPSDFALEPYNPNMEMRPFPFLEIPARRLQRSLGALIEVERFFESAVAFGASGARGKHEDVLWVELLSHSKIVSRRCTIPFIEYSLACSEEVQLGSVSAR